MQITVVGAGYIGLTVAACMTAEGYTVTCVDLDELKIGQLQTGVCPIYEPGLEELIIRGIESRRLSFTTDLAQAICCSSVILICVGTPSFPDGTVDMQAVFSVAEEIAHAMKEKKTLVLKSTVPIGTAETVQALIEGKTRYHCPVVSVPEFVREGTAVADFMNPTRVVIGARDAEVARLVQDIYQPFVTNGAPIFIMDNRSAELAKYAANLALAARLSLINELARLAEKVGADIELVRRAIVADPRIGGEYMFPGVGFGGSCLPKDIRALVRIGQQYGHPLRLAEAVMEVNEEQSAWFLRKILDHFGQSLKGRRLALWGLAFKPGTDDVRESPALRIAESLIKQEAIVTVYDPKSSRTAEDLLANRVIYATDQYACVQGAEALIVLTEWEKFKAPDFARVALEMKDLVIFDGRNIYDPCNLRKRGFLYYGVGRSSKQAE